MKLIRAALVVLSLLSGATVVAAQSSAATADIPALIRECHRRGQEMNRRVFDYSWTSKNTIRLLNKRGEVTKETVRVYEVYPVPSLSYVVQKLISENGLSLSPKRAAKEQRRLTDELMRAEVAQMMISMSADESASKEGASSPTCAPYGIWTVLNGYGGTEISLGVSDFLCAGEFTRPRAAKLHDRDTIVLDFRPRPDFKPDSPSKAPFAKLSGEVWIDAKERVVVRIEAWPRTESVGTDGQPKSSRPEPVIVFEDTRLPDGMWVRRVRNVNTTRHVALFNGVNLDWRQEFGEYRRYGTEVKDIKLEAPKSSQ